MGFIDVDRLLSMEAIAIITTTLPRGRGYEINILFRDLIDFEHGSQDINTYSNTLTIPLQWNNH